MQICKNIQLKVGITGTKVSQNVVSNISKKSIFFEIFYGSQ